MDNEQRLVAQEFAIYESAFSRFEMPDYEGAREPAETDAAPESIPPGNFSREECSALRALFNEAVAKSDVQNYDVARLCASHETVVSEMKELLNRLTAGVEGRVAPVRHRAKRRRST